MVQLSCQYMTTGKTIALTIGTFVRKVLSLLFNMLCRFVIAFLGFPDSSVGQVFYRLSLSQDLSDVSSWLGCAPWKKSYDKPTQHIKKQIHHFADKGPYSQSYGFSNIRVQMWELDYKEGWMPKNWCFWTAVLPHKYLLFPTLVPVT